jgi:3-isopropylmalate/(R)-2-methylmalate dehydratase small subunit
MPTPFIVHTGRAAPLRRSNVDTDQIIPAAFCKRLGRTGYADALFHAWRQQPDFVLNQSRYAGASLLVAGPEFGIGSSREHAVWALRDSGFQVVIAPSFGDIFRNNAGKNQLLTARVPRPTVERLWELVEGDPDIEVSADLEARGIRAGTLVAPFEIDDHTRWKLMQGLDDIEATLRHADAIAAYERARAGWLPAVETP